LSLSGRESSIPEMRRGPWRPEWWMAGAWSVRSPQEISLKCFLPPASRVRDGAYVGLKELLRPRPRKELQKKFHFEQGCVVEVAEEPQGRR